MSDTPCPFCGQIHGTACDATTPANPIGQIATVAATPVVAHDAQRYDWREELDMATDYGMSLAAAARVAAYIERLEAERDALLAEHEAVGEGYGYETADVGCGCLSCRIIRAHDNAERVIHGE